MRRTSSATLELPEDTLVMLSSIFCLRGNLHLLVHYWPQSGTAGGHFGELCETFLFSSDFSPSHITSRFMLFTSTSSSSSCTCSSFSNVLTLYVAIFSRSPPAWWFFLTHIFLAPPLYVVSVDPNHLLGHRHPFCPRQL